MFNFCLLPNCTIPDYESETELVTYDVHADGLLWSVDTRSEGIGLVKSFMSQGIMARLIEERAYWTKRAVAITSDLKIVYGYGLVWKQVN